MEYTVFTIYAHYYLLLIFMLSYQNEMHLTWHLRATLGSMKLK